MQRHAFRPVLAVLVAASVFPAGSATAADAPATADPAHATASFSIRHFTFSSVSGSIGVKSVELAVGPDRLPTRVVADLDLATIDTHDARRDDDLRGPHWFDVKSDPDMRFTSTRITGTPKAFVVAGDLSFHGVTKPVTLAATDEGTGSRDRSRERYRATATIDRTLWNVGLSYPAVAVGHDVSVTLEVDAPRGD